MKMKKLYFIPAAMLGLAVAGCSSDDLAVGEGQGPQWDSQGKGYMALSLNLPTQASTGMRQTPAPYDNDQFDDGEPSEYAVKDATLLIFKGSSETSATLQAAYVLPDAGPAFENPEDDQVTSTVQLTQQINRIDAGSDDLYALVVLNNNGIFSVDEYQQLNFTGADEYYGASGLPLTLQNLMNKVVGVNSSDVNASDAYTEDGILMMNAPLASAVGADSYSGTVSTLVKVTDGIYTTEREAQENPAANIYVERAVAKVSVTATNTSGTLATEDKPTTEKETGQEDVADWTIKGWMLNNTNQKSYFAHNYPTENCLWWGYQNGTKGYRFIGKEEVGKQADGTTTAGYRIYWGQDVNYNTAAGTGDPACNLNKINSTYFTTTNVHGLGLGEYDYCFENTFTTDFQNHDQTTQAVIAVEFNDGKDFWTLNGSTSTVYINQTDIDNIVKNAFYNTQAVKDVITENLKDDKTFNLSTDLEVTYDKGAAGSDVNDQAGKWTVTEISLTASGRDKLKNYEAVNAISSAEDRWTNVSGTWTQTGDENDGLAYGDGFKAAQALQIECYDNGLAYYPVNIKHFGDDLTPWDENDAEGNDSYPNTDRKAEANWLGRYGVLRNNWYQLDVTKVSNIGYSDVPQDNVDPDDPVARYISVRINILSWAVRKQSVQL